MRWVCSVGVPIYRTLKAKDPIWAPQYANRVHAQPDQGPGPHRLSLLEIHEPIPECQKQHGVARSIDCKGAGPEVLVEGKHISPHGAYQDAEETEQEQPDQGVAPVLRTSQPLAGEGATQAGGDGRQVLSKPSGSQVCPYRHRCVSPRTARSMKEPRSSPGSNGKPGGSSGPNITSARRRRSGPGPANGYGSTGLRLPDRPGRYAGARP